ncbi:MAG: fused MFS/spermidine synthase [Verrucomicrobiota bacterium]
MNRAARVDVNRMNQFTRRVLFFLFFLSGFCSLAYQVVWTRMAFASFGIITPVLSVVLSVFMLGLAVGAWAGGRFIASLVEKTGLSAVVFYACAELLIGLGAFAVPKLFAAGEYFLLAAGQTNSIGYLSWSALVLACSILPWCLFMGATFPLMMAYIRERDCKNTESFSFLYLANVLGAMSGTLLTAVVLVELLGFHHTLWVAAAGNFTIAVIGGYLGWKQRGFVAVALTEAERSAGPGNLSSPGNARRRLIKWILFSTGFAAMAMEVVWTRAFTPVLKTQVYSFALIVFAYLGATFLGSWWYRRDLRRNCPSSTGTLISALAMMVFLPVLANDPRLVAAYFWTNSMDAVSAIIVLASLCPFCALLGYLTPGLIDEYGAGQPKNAGQAYAINVLGCILGPLFACYVLLPHLSERHALILLSLPFSVFCLLLRNSQSRRQQLGWGLTVGAALTASLFLVRDFETMLLRTQKNTVVRRDYAATVISFGEARDKHLLVNGIGMTILTPITKFMVHLPMAFHPGRPESALIICFGMGTSYRSALNWNLDTTTVELVPSVTKTFGFYHADAARFINDPNGHVVVDDGRRFLKRTSRKYDIIVVDPPPPVEAAGSSLLYSKEFYELAKQHLKPGGILQMWFPGGEVHTGQAVIRSINESFPHVRCFLSVAGWGTHILASFEPIEQLDANQLAARMPESAKKDLLEWNDSQDAPAYIGLVVNREVFVPRLLNPDPKVQITDDQPYNEYFLLRQVGLSWH